MSSGRLAAVPLPAPGGLVFDVGASYGPAAGEFSSTWQAHVVVVEANYGFFNSYLAPAFKGLPEFTLVHAAVSDVDGATMTFYKACNDYLSSARKAWLTDPAFRFGNHSCFEETKVRAPACRARKLHRAVDGTRSLLYPRHI